MCLPRNYNFEVEFATAFPSIKRFAFKYFLPGMKSYDRHISF